MKVAVIPPNTKSPEQLDCLVEVHQSTEGTGVSNPAHPNMVAKMRAIPPPFRCFRRESVTVGVSGWTVPTIILFVPFSLPVHSFSTTLSRENMSSINNPVCN